MFGYFRRRRVRRMVVLARREYLDDHGRLASITTLTPVQRAALDRLLRRINVLYAGWRNSLGGRALFAAWYAAVAFLPIASAVCLLTPVVWLWADLTGEGWRAALLSLSCYLTCFGVLCGLYFVWRSASVMFSVSVVATGASVVLTAIALVTNAPNVAGPLTVGIEAAVIAALLIVIAQAVVEAFNTVFNPALAYQYRAGTLSEQVARSLWGMIVYLTERRGIYRFPRARRLAIRRMQYTITWIERSIPQGIWLAGVRGDAHRDAAGRCRAVAEALRAHQHRLLEARRQIDVDRLRDDLAGAAAALAVGDWSTSAGPSPTVGLRLRLAGIVRRLLPPVVLAGTAVALPHVPEVTINAAALTSIQTGLFVAAILSLIAIDAPQQDRILNAFSTATKTP